MSNFVHLHCHTEFSLLDGAIRLKDLCAKAKSFNMPAVAVTDHGNMHAALPFFLAAKAQEIKPLIGCEVYVSHDHTDRESAQAKRRHHLVLLAQNKEGYHNLIKLVSHGALHGFHYRPRVDKALLAQYSKGVVALSACLAGEIPRALMSNDHEHALKLAEEYAAIYPNRFFLELQSNGLKEQEILNTKLLELAETTKLPLVATNDCHYLNADDYESHDTLLCVQTLSLVADPKRMRFETKELYYKSPEEMSAAFAHVPEAIDNTVRIATELCENIEFDFKTNYFPVYALPEGVSIEDEFRRLSQDGLTRRLAAMSETVDKQVYLDRLEFELNVICEMGFPAYFLIVQDFINWAKDNDIPVGPGRGSAAGSLVAFSLRITNIDPLPYNLLFERFLNNERVSLPDIDVDFCERNRHRVIDYVCSKYGADSVAQITTFGTMKAKAALRDVGRARGLSFAETDRLAKLIPNDLNITLKKALEMEPDLKAIYDTEPESRKLLDISMRLEGLSRHASTHAAGVVISDKPMHEYLPLYRGKRNEVVTQYDMKMVEKVGLVKFDFLGLSTMTLLYDVLDNIRRQGKEVPDLDILPFTDEETYKLYAAGDTDGIFQVESSGMRQYLRMLKPNCFEDIIAMLALYRPGPLGSGMVDEFIKRKHGEVEVSYPLPSLETCLKDTYGVIVYQEQVMQIAQIVAKYTLGGADLLRRAMGKKDPAAMAAERSRFVEGAQSNNVSKEKANEIFNLMEKFAEYGFNKSHSAAYAVISYHTAFLKTHYKKEFMAALLSSQMGNQDKLLKYIASCKSTGLDVSIPDINASFREFSVKGEKILFGLGGIKSVGDEAIREIVEARNADGEFSSMLDLCCRVNLRKVTKRVLENMIKGGACDSLGVSRHALFSHIDPLVARAQKKQKAKASNQGSLFSMLKQEDQPLLSGLGFSVEGQDVLEWSDEEKLVFEKEALGFFLSSHPLQPFVREMARLSLLSLEDSRECSSQQKFSCGVLVTAIKEFITKKGSRMAFTQIEDLTASGECVIFPDLYAEHRELLNSDQPLLLEVRTGEMEDASLDDEENVAPIKLVALSVRSLAEACAACVEPIVVQMPLAETEKLLNPERLAQLKNLLFKYRGRVPLQLNVSMGDKWCKLELGREFLVQPSPELEADLAAWIL